MSASPVPAAAMPTAAGAWGGSRSTRRAPCDVARDLSKQGLDLRVEAIGFQVDPAARAQLARIAKATGGAYYDAPDSRALTGQLTALSLRAYRDFAPIGAPIAGTADPSSAPPVTPGAWVDELTPGESRSYAVDVTDKTVPVVNAALIAGATQPRLAVPENLIVTFTDLAGNECARRVVSQTVATFTASATTIGARAAQDGASACAQPGRHIVTVQRPIASGQGVNTLEIRFSQIGEPSPGPKPAPAVAPGPAGGQRGDAISTRGGTSYGDAPNPGTGSWKDTLRVGETLYYRVPVGWGQSLAADVHLRLLPTSDGGTRRMMPVVEVHDALRVDPLNRKIVQLSGSAAQTVSIETPNIQSPVQAADQVAPFRIAGSEYLVINGAKFLDDSTTATASMRIDLTLGGAQVEGPRLAVVGAGTSPSATPQRPTPRSTRKTAPSGRSDPGGPPMWLLAGGVVLFLAVPAALDLAGRRRAGRRPTTLSSLPPSWSLSREWPCLRRVCEPTTPYVVASTLVAASSRPARPASPTTVVNSGTSGCPSRPKPASRSRSTSARPAATSTGVSVNGSTYGSTRSGPSALG